MNHEKPWLRSVFLMTLLISITGAISPDSEVSTRDITALYFAADTAGDVESLMGVKADNYTIFDKPFVINELYT